MAYRKTFSSNVWGLLLKAFDTYCVSKEVNESEGLRDCISVYIRYLESGQMAKARKLHPRDTSNKKFVRRLQAQLHGNQLHEFQSHCDRRLMSYSEGIREAIRIATNYGENIKE